MRNLPDHLYRALSAYLGGDCLRHHQTHLDTDIRRAGHFTGLLDPIVVKTGNDKGFFSIRVLLENTYGGFGRC